MTTETVGPDGALPGALHRIGEGRTAEILAWNPGQVLRLYRPGSARAWVLREMNVTHAVHAMGLPCPAVYPADTGDGLIELEDRVGFVMERVDGPTMMEDLAARPWRVRRHAQSFARLHVEIHSTLARDLPSQRARFHRILDGLTDDLGPAMVNHIRDAMPDPDGSERVCHGDFHPDNILLSPRGPIVIDWGPASGGLPAADIAWTLFLFRHGAAPVDASPRTRILIALFRAAFSRTYRRAYCRAAGLDWETVTHWSPVIAAIRLGDRIPEERAPILEILRAAYGTSS
ncbi:MAG: phosphotransferase [Candidatus Bipolaricaulota bacterium]|nr:MAG: phosphotransferase [Candidatus Bipolaricaulota bacterium]